MLIFDSMRFDKQETRQAMNQALLDGKEILLETSTRAEPYLLAYLVKKVDELESRLKELEE